MTGAMKHRKPIEVRDRTQHGDPIPERVGDALTPDELAGKATPAPVRTGPIATTRTCGMCRGKVVGDACPVCAPAARPGLVPFNSTDKTLTRGPGVVTNDVVLPWIRALR